MKKLYFIVPVYQAEAYLKQCADSVLGQDYPDIELILVDDGSPDRCPELCDAYAAKHKNVTVIHRQNGGLSAARNSGLDYVCGNAAPEDYLTFLDSDDFVKDTFARRMLALCEENDCETAQCGYEKGETGRFREEGKAPPAPVVGPAEDMLLDQRLKSQSWAKIYRVSLFAGLRFPEGMLNEDEFVTYRAVYRAQKAALTGEALYYYRQNGQGIMETIATGLKDNPRRGDYLLAYRERIAFFEREGKPQQVMRTHEKICTDLILRYVEQMRLKKDQRDADCVSGGYLRLYREHFPQMIRRRGISPGRRLMYLVFYLVPYSAVWMGNLFGLRK